MDWMIEAGYSPIPVTLSRSVEEAPRVKSFYFEYPKDELTYEAGQTFHLHLNFEEDPDGYHVFSIASSPTEDHLIFTMRMREESSYKRSLDAMELGTELVVLGPSGSYVLPEDESSEAVFLGHDIGVTPFRSMSKYATDEGLGFGITLLYSNRTPEKIVYKEEWRELAEKNPNLTVVHTMTHPEESEKEWDGRVGTIDEELVRQEVGNLSEAHFYVCGTPSAVRQLIGVLVPMGLRGRVKADTFKGYE